MGRDVDDGAATRVWLSAAEEPLRPPSNRLKWVALGILAVMCGVVGIIVAVAPESAQQPGALSTTSAGRAESVSPGAVWTPAKGESRTVEISAVGLPSFSEADLGAVFDSKLRRVPRSPNLFARREISKLRRNEFSHSVRRVQSRLELGIVVATILGGSYRRDRFYAVYRAMEVGSISRIEDRAPMLEPPPEATFYLTEIHIGSSYDVVIEGLSRDMGAKLDRELTAGKLALSAGLSSSDYRVVTRGLGLRPRHGSAIFAKTPEQVEAAYTTEGAAVPVRLVFRQIPGRKFPADGFKWPTPYLEQEFTLREAKSRSFEIPVGTYSLHVRTRPNGVHVFWRDGKCKGGTFVELTSVCKVTSPTTLTIKNPSVWELGSSEAVILSVYKGRDTSAIESSSPGR